MAYDYNTIIRVHSKGSAETTFKRAVFEASVETRGKTGPQAKELAQPAIEQVKKVVKQYAERAQIDLERLKTTFSVDTERNYQTREFLGYKAAYSIKFESKNVSEATSVHDALTSIDGVVSPSPIFLTNAGDDDSDDAVEADDAYQRAFEEAVDRARHKFEHQCDALNLHHLDYAITSWEVREEQPHGKTMSLGTAANGAKPESVGVEPGKGRLDLTLTLSFARKA